jgi:hypothetical protein
LRKRTTPDFIGAFGRLPRLQTASLLPSSPSMRVWSAVRHLRWLMANDPVDHAWRLR